MVSTLRKLFSFSVLLTVVQSFVSRKSSQKLTLLSGFLALVFAAPLGAHSVGQVQTTKFFAPETVDYLVQQATAGTPGFKNGDIIHYIVQFTPVSNGATVGPNGYITDYIPAGTEVVGAAIVEPSGGSYTPVSPYLPGPISDGWGWRGEQTFGGAFATNAYDPTGKCAAAGKTNDCNGSLAEIYADTGIFFSTDSRTAVSFAPDTDGRVRQGTNGYDITPTAEGQLNPIIGQARATTHNLWDADQTNAFGSKQGDINNLASPSSTAPALLLNKEGQGATPFYSGSAVAGSGSGYQLDNTGAVGPWQRISYPGSRIGCTNNCNPAIDAANGNTTAIKGSTTSAGWSVSESNPLPSSVNAVRWAAGRLVVGQNRYVRISLRLTQTPPTSGIINNSEVFGGDSAEAAGDKGQDNAWRYHVPSVADNNSNLYVFKQVIAVNGSPSAGEIIPANALVRYRITYLNSGNSSQTNVTLSDTLPSQTNAGAVSNIVIISGPTITPITPASPVAGGSFQFVTVPALGPGLGGSVEFDVQTAAANGDLVLNVAKLVSDQVPSGITSTAVSYVDNAANLSISKSVTPAEVSPGGTVTYTITVENKGTANASNIIVNDFLPTSGGVLDANTRFNFVTSTSVVNGITSATPVVSAPPVDLTYSTQNREQLTWDFAAATLAPGSSFTIEFNATVGANVPATSTPYGNDATLSYNNGTVDLEAGIVEAAPVTVAAADLAVAISVDNNAPQENDTIIYSVVVSNLGYSDASNVSLTDLLPAGVSYVSDDGGTTYNSLDGEWFIGSLANGASITLNITATVDAGTQGTVIANATNNVTADQFDTNVLNNADSVSIAVGGSDLSVTKTVDDATPAVGESITYTLTVTNNNGENATNVSLTDLLPSGVSYVSDDGAGAYVLLTGGVWTIGNLNVGQSVSLNIIATVDTGTAGNAISNTADTLSADQPDPDSSNNSASVIINIPAPDISTSVKLVADLNGGDANPGDVLRYTIRITESAGGLAENLSVTDNVPANVSNFTVISIPAGASDNSLPTGGSNGTGLLDISNITVAPNSVVTIVFDVTINAVSAGTVISNTANVVNPDGENATPVANDIIVAQSSIPATGTKQLYFYGSGVDLNRTPPDLVVPQPANATTPVNILAKGGVQTWILTPETQGALTIAGSTIPVVLWFDGAGDNKKDRGVTVELLYRYPPSVTETSLGSIPLNISNSLPNTAQEFIFNVPITGPVSFTPGVELIARVTNTSNKNGRDINIYPVSNGEYSRVELNATTVINVDDVSIYAVAYTAVPNTTTKADYVEGDDVFIRTVISDPFGSFDISSATIDIIDSQGVTQVDSAVMSEVFDSGTATKTYEYGYSVPSGAYPGAWTARVTGIEGTEGLVSDLGVAAFNVQALPAIMMLKTVQTLDDPVNGVINPKAIPGASVLYTITATNFGLGSTDVDSVIITDPIPNNTELFVGDLNAGLPVKFSDGSISSALTYFDIQFTENGGVDNYAYVPVSGVDYDDKVTHLKLLTKGSFAGSNGTDNPSFTLQFKVRVQ